MKHTHKKKKPQPVIIETFIGRWEGIPRSAPGGPRLGGPRPSGPPMGGGGRLGGFGGGMGGGRGR